MTAATTPDEFLAAKKPHEVTVPIALDGDETVEFTFEALGKTAYRDLLLEHPPTEKQRQEFRTEQRRLGVPQHALKRLEFNPDEFPPVLLSAACTSHKWTTEDWARVLDNENLNAVEAAALVEAAIKAQVTRRTIPPEA